MRIRHHRHHTVHHKAAKKKKTPSSTSRAAERVMLSQGQTSMSQADTQFAELVRQVSSALLTAGWMAEVVAAIEQVVESKLAAGPGNLIPGVVSNLAGGVQPANGSAPTLVMVFLNGSTLASPVYVPPHLVGDVAAGEEVWVRAANGNMHDLILDSIRAFNTAPASASYFSPSNAAPASKVTPGSFPAGRFSLVSPANGSGNPDTLALFNGAQNQFSTHGVSEAGDTVNAPGAYFYDSFNNIFLAKGGLLQPGGMAAGNLPSGVKQQNGATIAGLSSAGGGAAGTRVWEGTTDPGGSAAEGDIWVNS